MRPMRASGLFLVVAFIAGGAAPAQAQRPLQVGEVRSQRAESPHPYPLGRGDRPVVWRETIVSRGAAFLRLRFRGLALAPGDYLTVSNPDGSDFWTYTGRGPKGTGRFWSFAVEGDTAIVEIHAGPRNAHGYHIDAIGHGTVDLRRPLPIPESLCGTDGREDVACYPEIDAAGRPVARLLFASGGSLFVCTGWLVEGDHDSTLMTNHHCIANQLEVDSLQATFNYQRAGCGTGENAIAAHYGGGTLLKTNPFRRSGKNGGLDYTLLTLRGNPEATWGELVPTGKPVRVDDLIWFIQHPAGDLKKVGYWEDAAKTLRCGVDAVDQTYGSTARRSQIAYACDSQGGSSGSPVVDELTGRVIALHHLGGVSPDGCLNAGTAMSEICADAGSLLYCADASGPPPAACDLGQRGDSCQADADCCSGKCRGRREAPTCR